MNGVKTVLKLETDRTTFYSLDDLLFEPKFSDERKGEKRPATASAILLPPLKPRMSFGLRLLEAHLFGAIWRQTKHELQILKAKENSELCFLPKEVGPCRRGFSARFFFNSDSGTCEPFAVSPLRLQSSV